MQSLNKISSLRLWIAALLIMAMSLIFIPAKTLAQTDVCPERTSLLNGLCVPDQPAGQEGFTSAKTLPELALQILQFLLTLAGVIGVVMIIVGGYWYLTSAGNDEQAEKGKKALIQSIIGLIVIVLAYAIVTLIINTVTKEVVF